MCTNSCVWCCSFLKTINPGLTFVRTKNSDQQMRENDNSRNDLCGFYFHSLNWILSGTIEIERRIRKNELSGNDRSRFHCISIHAHYLQLTTMNYDELDMYISFRHNQVVNSNCTKFLGLNIDNKLSWKNHIDYLITKLSLSCFIMRVIKPIMSYSSLRIYFAYIHSIMT
jgi:hypothetical protein